MLSSLLFLCCNVEWLNHGKNELKNREWLCLKANQIRISMLAWLLRKVTRKVLWSTVGFFYCYISLNLCRSSDLCHKFLYILNEKCSRTRVWFSSVDIWVECQHVSLLEKPPFECFISWRNVDAVSYQKSMWWLLLSFFFSFILIISRYFLFFGGIRLYSKNICILPLFSWVLNMCMHSPMHVDTTDICKSDNLFLVVRKSRY